MPGAFSHVVVGVRDLDVALRFWRDELGLELRARRAGPDEALAALWDLRPDDIRDQAIVATPGCRAGALHLVQWHEPAPPVRAGAKPHDLLPKNLDVYTRDLPARYDELVAAGHVFRSPWAEMPGPDGLVFREVHLPAHDDINVVLLEVIGPGYDTPLSPKGYAAVGPLVTIVPDAARELVFWRDVLGLDVTLELELTGPVIERVIGLPPGSGLDIRVAGDRAEPLGRVEMIQYRNVAGANRFALAKPPATGILHVLFQVTALEPVRQRLAGAGIPCTDHGEVDALFGRGPLLSCRSPAGFRFDVQGRR